VPWRYRKRLSFTTSNIEPRPRRYSSAFSYTREATLARYVSWRANIP
jgi:hypothetical protein